MARARAPTRRSSRVGVSRVLTALLCPLLIATIGLATTVGGAAASPPNFALTTPSRASVTTVELNLLHHHHLVSSHLVYDGYYGTRQTYFPTLLKGNNTSKFWTSNQSVLELAPEVGYGHSGGIALFGGKGAAQVTVRMIASFSPILSGDGLEAYLYVSPLTSTSWGVPYYATNPEGTNGTFMPCQGDMIFPYSHTPYIAMQWDPAYQLAGCGAGHPYQSFNVYIIRPAPNGTVGASNITGIGPLGAISGNPSTGDYVQFSLTYTLKSSELKGSVLDLNSTLAGALFNQKLSAYSFSPGYNASASYYFGIGASANTRDSWGALYAALIRS